MSVKTIIIIAVIILVGIQFIRPKKNILVTASPSNISILYPVPEGVDTVLRKACYDCHSNNTKYPGTPTFSLFTGGLTAILKMANAI